MSKKYNGTSKRAQPKKPKPVEIPNGTQHPIDPTLAWCEGHSRWEKVPALPDRVEEEE